MRDRVAGGCGLPLRGPGDSIILSSLAPSADPVAFENRLRNQRLRRQATYQLSAPRPVGPPLQAATFREARTLNRPA